MPSIQLEDLISGFHFASGNLDESGAYLDLETGEIHFLAEGMDLEEPPEDIDNPEKFLPLPDKRELDLGNRLAMQFIRDKSPENYTTVAGFFKHRGAYTRFKDFLATHDLLQNWYDFENEATISALKEWCEQNGIELIKAGEKS